MSLGIYPVFEPQPSNVRFNVLGETLADAMETLDEIADEYGLTRFTAFSDSREVPEGFDGSPDDLAELLGPCNEWFDAAAGAVAFGAIVKLIRNEQMVAKKLHHSKAVVHELEELIRVLQFAAKQGSKFRLEMS